MKVGNRGSLVAFAFIGSFSLVGSCMLAYERYIGTDVTQDFRKSARESSLLSIRVPGMPNPREPRGPTATSSINTIIATSVDGVVKTPPKLGKSGKKICCSCPETKSKRDECVIKNGESECQVFIEAHKACLREEGFTVK